MMSALAGWGASAGSAGSSAFASAVANSVSNAAVIRTDRTQAPLCVENQSQHWVLYLRIIRNSSLAESTSTSDAQQQGRIKRCHREPDALLILWGDNMRRPARGLISSTFAMVGTTESRMVAEEGLLASLKVLIYNISSDLPQNLPPSVPPRWDCCGEPRQRCGRTILCDGRRHLRHIPPWRCRAFISTIADRFLPHRIGNIHYLKRTAATFHDNCPV